MFLLPIGLDLAQNQQEILIYKMVRRHEHANHGYQAANAKDSGENVQIPCVHFVNYNTDCLDHAGLESFNIYVDQRAT